MDTRRERVVNAIVRAVEEQPVIAIGVLGTVASGVLSGGAKFWNAKTEAKKATTQRRNVDRLIKKSKKS